MCSPSPFVKIVLQCIWHKFNLWSVKDVISVLRGWHWWSWCVKQHANVRCCVSADKSRDTATHISKYRLKGLQVFPHGAPASSQHSLVGAVWVLDVCLAHLYNLLQQQKKMQFHKIFIRWVSKGTLEKGSQLNIWQDDQPHRGSGTHRLVRHAAGHLSPKGVSKHCVEVPGANSLSVFDRSVSNLNYTFNWQFLSTCN